MAQNTNWQKVFNAIGAAQATQVYRGYRGHAHHWSLQAELSAEDATQIKAYMQEHDGPVENFNFMMNTGFTNAGKRWKFNNKVLPVLAVFGGLGGAALIGSMIETNVCLGFLIVFAAIAFLALRNHPLRRMKAVWKGGGSVSNRLDRMCEMSAKPFVVASIVPLAVVLALALPLIIGAADPKLYPYMQAADLMKKGQYEDAAQAFAKLRDYKDAPEQKNAAYITLGDKHMDLGNYYRAQEAYEKAGHTQGVSAAYYVQGEEYVDEGDIEHAIYAFQNAGDYLDAPQRVGELYYAKAEAALEAGDEPAAIEAFTAAGDWGNAKERISGIYRARAEAYLADGEAEQAAQQFILAGDMQRVEELTADMIAAHDYAAAARVYQAQGDEDGAQHMRYLEAVWHYENANYAYAYLCFSAMADYVPAEGRSAADYLADEAVAAAAADTLWYTPGSIVTFGAWEQDNVRSNGAEPLEWVVLDSDGQKTLLMTRYAIDHIHNDMTELRWEPSPSRAWLNGDFYAIAFSRKERAAILTTKVQNGVDTSNPQYGRDGGPATEDEIFLLSYQEALRYLGKESDPPVATAYAKEQGVHTFNGCCDSLLRSVNYSSYMDEELGAAISQSGQLVQHSGGHFVNSTGIQPVMWVDVDAALALQ